jgi:hypothetical protein
VSRSGREDATNERARGREELDGRVGHEHHVRAVDGRERAVRSRGRRERVEDRAGAEVTRLVSAALEREEERAREVRGWSGEPGIDRRGRAFGQPVSGCDVPERPPPEHVDARDQPVAAARGVS